MITTLIKPPHTKDWEDELDIILNLSLEYWGSNRVDLVRGIIFFWPSQNEDPRWGKPNLPPYPKHPPQEEEQYPMKFEQLVWRDMGANGQNVNQTRKDEWESRTWQVFKKEQEEAEEEDAWGNQGIRPVWVGTSTYQEENLRSSSQEARQIKEAITMPFLSQAQVEIPIMYMFNFFPTAVPIHVPSPGYPQIRQERSSPDIKMPKSIYRSVSCWDRKWEVPNGVMEEWQKQIRNEKKDEEIHVENEEEQ